MSPVSLSKADALAERMKELGIRESDLRETFVRSGGKGGQNVNKVSTCVVLVHVPTRTAVKCQLERTQAMNRYRARVMLTEKIEKRVLGERRAAAARVAKIGRQKRRRSRKAKEKLLHDKRVRSEAKARRRPVGAGPHDD
jgi:protein subunit release factor B